MDALYEVTLLASLLAGAAALALALWGRGPGAGRRRRRWVAPAALSAWIALLVSFVVHLWWGHRPGSPQALGPVAFLGEHVSFLVAASLPGLAWIVRAAR